MNNTNRQGLLFLFCLAFLFLIVFPNLSHAAVDSQCPEGTASGSVCLVNPLKFGNIEFLSPHEVVEKGFIGFATLIGTIAIAFLVYSGFKLVIASDEEAIKSARTAVTWSVGGFIVALLAFTIVSGAAKLIGFDPSLVDYANDSVGPVLNGPTDPGSFISVMNFIMINLLGLIGFATTLMIIYYGYRYLTSAGNEESIEKARTGLKWSIVGFIVSFLAFAIITIVRQLLLVGPGK